MVIKSYDEVASDMIGKVLLDRYRIDGLLGQGGTSDVYRAFDTVLERTVAIKVLARSLGQTDKSYERFLREAKVTSKLNHPNILSIFDFGILPEKQVFLVTEYIAGPSLEDILQQQDIFSEQESVKIFRQLAEGLQYAHSNGVIHRDVKPSNVIIVEHGDNKLAKLIDFGMLTLLQDEYDMQKLTQEGSVLGSAFYMSPEQCSGMPLTQSTDIYSLGCLMYECLSGELPICGANPMQTLQMHVSSQAPRLSEVHPYLNSDLESLVMRCLEKSPSDRPESMKAVASELSGLELGLSMRSSKAMNGQSENITSNLNSQGEEVTQSFDAEAKTAASKRRNLITIASCVFALLLGFSLTQLGSLKQASNNSPTDAGASNQHDGQAIQDKQNKSQAQASAASAKNNKDANKPKQIEHLVELAKECHSQGKCDEALELLQRSVKLSSDVFGPKSEKTKARMKDLSVMYLTLGMDKEAADTISQINKLSKK